MSLFCSEEEEFKNFLGAYFHLDIVSYEQALENFLENESSNSIKNTIVITRNFIISPLSNVEKNKIIKSEAWINFDYYRLTPIDWLKEVLRILDDGYMRRMQKICVVKNDFEYLSKFLWVSFFGKAESPQECLTDAIESMSKTELDMCVKDIERLLASKFPLEYIKLFVSHYTAINLEYYDLTSRSLLEDVRKAIIENMRIRFLHSYEIH